MVRGLLQSFKLRLWCVQYAKPFLTVAGFQEFSSGRPEETLWKTDFRGIALLDKTAVYRLQEIVGHVKIGAYEKWDNSSEATDYCVRSSTPGVMLRIYPNFMKKYGKLTPYGLFIPTYLII